MEDNKEIHTPYRHPVSQAKDSFMVLIGVDRDGDTKLGQQLAKRIKEKLAQSAEQGYEGDVVGLVKRYSLHETGEPPGDLGALTKNEIERLKAKYNLP